MYEKLHGIQYLGCLLRKAINQFTRAYLFIYFFPDVFVSSLDSKTLNLKFPFDLL